MATRSTKNGRFVRGVFNNIGGYIDGSKPDRHGIGNIFWTHLTHYLYKKIHEAYIIKSQGGTDELGNSWKPIKKETVAKRPIGRGELGGLGLDRSSSGLAYKNRTRGLLSPEEDSEWRKIYSATIHRLQSKGVSLAEAKQIAAKNAWAKLKAQGAKTKLEVLGSRDALIMRVTDTILKSLEPSSISSRGYRPKKNQIYEKAGSKLTIGTLVPYAKFHNNRPIIPDNIDPWVQQGISIALEAAMNRAKQVVA